MRWTARALLAVTAGLAIGAAATSEAVAEPTVRTTAAPATEMSAQQRVRRPPRVTIYPIYRPRPMYRQCADGYVVEQRVATGPTVVPRILCWWVRG